MNAVCVYDFTVSGETNKETILKTLKIYCKKFCFQKEKGDSGYEHYQGRFSLKVKLRIGTLISKNYFEGYHLSITSGTNKDNDFYVTKEDTRIAGPWKDTDEEIYIPRQIRGIELRTWQKQIVALADIFDTRKIHCIIDTTGNIGKTILCTYIGAHRIGKSIPFANDYKDILRMVMDMPISKLYTIDMPRAVNKERLGQMYAALETVKGGYAYDDRYKFKDQYFDCPQIVVFTNKVPDRGYLSKDRWNMLTVNPETWALESWKDPIKEVF